ncbi:MAG: zinc-dependent alcohol dehydrogenase family protein [Alphaproteobacteria bacterium]
MRGMAIQGEYGLDNLRTIELPDPQPPEPGQVLVRMAAASLNFRDLLIAQNLYGGNFPLPLVPLSDGCGVIEAVGEGVSRVKPGDRVCPSFFPDWIAGPPRVERRLNARGGPLPGCAQAFMSMSAEAVSKVPEHLSDAEAASLPCAALTAWRTLIVEGKLAPGERVLVEGTGGVSIFALQFAKAAGAEVIITSSSDEKLERARSLGADHTINYRQYPEWSKKVREAAGGEGVDHVVEVGGAETTKEALKSIRPGGQIGIIGVLSGPKQSLQIGAMIATCAVMRGISVGSRDDFEAMCRALDVHRIRPVVDRILPLEELPEAFRLMEAGKHFGKICVDVTA